ncbi:MAG: glutamate synthase subunit beta [Candidatus Omnitrophica bacterium]|nr:glutamate synthase subunit beta [Candidatus Omnitrophota bacterium]
MDKNKGFMRIYRKEPVYRPVCERVKDYKQIFVMRNEHDSRAQARRCMDCGTPFCHNGCPIGNFIPEWNKLIFNGNWDHAVRLLQATNPMPEVTGRICPSLCEYSCVLGLNDDAVTVRENELSIAEFGFEKDIIKPRLVGFRSGKKIAVVGSGPAGLSCAQKLNMLGHSVTVFERDEKPGGLLRYGIPNFKLEKSVLDRRIKLWEKEGVFFKTQVNMGIDRAADSLLKDFDAVCLACGCRVPRDISVPGRGLKGVYFAMDYLSQANKTALGERHQSDPIDVKGKRVVVIGGGDTGSDCVGTANRQGALCVTQLEIMPMPPACRTKDCLWPKYPLILRNSSSHQEGCLRRWSIATKAFEAAAGRVNGLLCAKVEWTKESENSCPVMREISGADFKVDADIVLIAAGFVSVEKNALIDSLGLEMDKRGNIKTGPDYMTSKKPVFCAGDMRRGQSLVVWAIEEGLKCAQAINNFITKNNGKERRPGGRPC